MESKKSFFDAPKEELPSTLDIVKVDGRWAQVFSYSSEGGLISFYWLGDTEKRPTTIRYDDLEIEKYPIRTTVKDIEDEFTEQQLDSLHYAAGENTPAMKRHIRVFGELRTKKH